MSGPRVVPHEPTPEPLFRPQFLGVISYFGAPEHLGKAMRGRDFIKSFVGAAAAWQATIPIGGTLETVSTEANSAHLNRMQSIWLALAVGAAYFAMTLLSTSLMPTPVYSLFWPAAGVASGVLIALGPSARWPVAAGVAIATTVQVLLKYRGFVNASVMVVGNAAEPLIVAGLLSKFVGSNFRLDRLSHLIGLLAAAVAGCGAVAILWSIVFWFSLALPMLTTWRDLTSNDSIGVALVAPSVIGVIAALRQPPPRSELIEGTATITLLVVVTAIILSLPPQPWDRVVPAAWLFPMLLLMASRYQPVFSAVGVFLVSIAIISATILGYGYFGDVTRTMADRSVQAVAVMLFVTFCSLFLSALFAERKESEASLAHSNMMLKRERENKLMNINAATSSIAHEVRQPLAAITTYSAAARRWLARVPPDVDRATQLLGEIERAGLRASEVLTNVRGLFQDADQEQQPIDVNNLASETLQILHGELNDHRIKTDLALTPELPVVMGQRVQLQEVIVNLVKNAIEAMVSSNVDHRMLKLRTMPDGGKAVIIEVEDTGQGIEPEHLGSIFDAFRTTKPHGMGLGLAISSRIVEGHGGQLTASSNGKNGALFKIILPAVTSPVAL